MTVNGHSKNTASSLPQSELTPIVAWTLTAAADDQRFHFEVWIMYSNPIHHRQEHDSQPRSHQD